VCTGTPEHDEHTVREGVDRPTDPAVKAICASLAPPLALPSPPFPAALQGHIIDMLASSRDVVDDMESEHL